METFLKAIGLLVVGTGVVVLICLLISFPVKWCWNAVVPDIFGLKELTWTQALWLTLLCGFLFKSKTSSKSSS